MSRERYLGERGKQGGIDEHKEKQEESGVVVVAERKQN